MLIERSHELQFTGRYGLFIARQIELCFSGIIAAAVFSLDFYFDRMDVIPDAAGAIFFGFAVILISRKRYERIAGILLSACYAFISVWNIFSCHVFNEEYSLSGVFYTASTTEKYIELEIYAVLEATLGFLCLLFALRLVLIKVKKTTTAYCHQLYAVKPEECARDYAFEVRRSMVGCSIVGALHFSSKVVYCFLLPYSNYVSVLSAITAVFILIRMLTLSSLVRQGLCDRIKEL